MGDVGGAGSLATEYVTIRPDMDQFVSELAADLQEATNSLHPTVKVKADTSEFDADVEGATETADKATGTATIGGNTKPLLASLAAGIAAIDGSKATVTIEGNMAPLTGDKALSDILNLIPGFGGGGSGSGGGNGGGGFTIPVPGGGGGSGGGGGGGGGNNTPDALLGLAFAKYMKKNTPHGLHDALYGAEDTSFLSGILSPATFFSKMFSAQFGSIGSLAGFGPEHLATTVAGIGGLGVAGGIGGGLLAGGALAKTGVGAGADALVSATLSSNVKNATADVTALNTAIAQYGANSTQAKTAQAALNAEMASVAPVARSAVEGLVEQQSALKNYWQMAIGPAEVEAAGLRSSLLSLASDYIPFVAQSAKTNLGEVATGLKPLFSWLEGPEGKGIFQNLENEFAKGIPASMGAFTNGLELLLKILNLASEYTGGFTEKLDKLFTKDNTAAGFAKISTSVEHLINDFHTVEQFLLILGKTLVDIFKNDAGTATSLVKMLTGALENLDKWINSIAGKDQLKNLFSVHKTELLDLLKALEPLLVNFGKAYLEIAPAVVGLVTDLLKMANAFYDVSQKIPGLKQLVDVGIVLLIFEKRSHLVTTAITLFRDVLGDVIQPMIAFTEGMLGMDVAEMKVNGKTNVLAAQVGKVASAMRAGLVDLGAWAAGILGIEVESEGLQAVLGVGVIGGLVLLGVAIYELVKHLGAMRTVMIAGAVAIGILAAAWLGLDVASAGILPIIGLIATALAGLVVGIIYVATHWHQTWTAIKGVVSDAVGFIKTHLSEIGLALSILFPEFAIAAAVVYELVGHWRAAWSVIVQILQGAANLVMAAIQSVADGLKATWTVITTAVTVAWDLTVGIIKAALDIIIGIVKVFIDLLTGNWSAAWNALKGIFSSVWNALTGAITGAFHAVVSAVVDLGKDIVNAIVDVPKKMLDAGKDMISGLVKGIKDGAEDAVHAAGKLGSDVLGGFRKVVGWFSNWQTMIFAGKDAGAGLAQGINDNAQVAIQAAAKLGKDVSNAFGNLKVPAQTEAAVKAITGIFTQLSNVFASMNKLPSGNSGALTILHITQTLQELAKAAPSLVKPIQEVEDAFKKLGSGGSLGTVDKLLGNVGTLFQKFGSIVSETSKITNLGMLSIVVALRTMSGASQEIVGALAGVLAGFSSLDKSKDDMQDLANLTKVIGDLNTVLKDFTNIMKDSAGDWSVGIGDLVANLQTLAGESEPLTAAIKAIEKEFDNLGNLNTLKNNLSTLKTALGDLNGVFTTLQTTAKNASGNIPSEMTTIATAITGIQTAMNNLSTKIGGNTTTVTTAISTMDSAITKDLNTLVASMPAIGKSIPEGLATGINSTAKQAATAAHNAAENAVSAVNAVVKPGSPSRTFTLIGVNMMEGLAQGITQGLATHVLPAMTTAANSMVSGFNPRLNATLGVSATGTSAFGMGATMPATTVGASGTIGHYNPQYYITGTDSDTVKKLQSMLDDHDNELLELIKRQ